MNRDWRLIGGLAAAGTALGLVGYTAFNAAQSGHILVTEDAADMADKSISYPAVDFYRGVCGELNRVIGAPSHIIDAAEASIGADSDLIAAKYSKALSLTQKDLITAREKLTDVNAHAPKITAVNATSADYAGALSPVIDGLERSESTVNGLIQDPRWQNETPRALNDAASESLTSVNDIVRGIIDEFATLQDRAPVFSTSTAEAIQGSTDCAQLMGSEFQDEGDQDIAIEGIVDLRRIEFEAHLVTVSSVERLGILQDVSASDIESASDFVSESLKQTASKSKESADAIESWENPYRPKTREFRATRDAADLISSSPAVYESLAEVANRYADQFDQVGPENVDHFETLMQDLGDELRQVQVDEARAHLRFSAKAPNPTAATAEAVKAIDAGSKTQREVVNHYNAVADAYKQLSDSFNALPNVTDLSELSSISSQIITQTDELAPSVQFDAEFSGALAEFGDAATAVVVSVNQTGASPSEATMSHLGDVWTHVNSATFASLASSWDRSNQSTREAIVEGRRERTS